MHTILCQEPWISALLDWLFELYAFKKSPETCPKNKQLGNGWSHGLEWEIEAPGHGLPTLIGSSSCVLGVKLLKRKPLSEKFGNETILTCWFTLLFVLVVILMTRYSAVLKVHWSFNFCLIQRRATNATRQILFSFILTRFLFKLGYLRVWTLQRRAGHSWRILKWNWRIVRGAWLRRRCEGTGNWSRYPLLMRLWDWWQVVRNIAEWKGLHREFVPCFITDAKTWVVQLDVSQQRQINRIIIIVIPWEEIGWVIQGRGRKVRRHGSHSA